VRPWTRKFTEMVPLVANGDLDIVNPSPVIGAIDEGLCDLRSLVCNEVRCRLDALDATGLEFGTLFCGELDRVLNEFHETLKATPRRIGPVQRVVRCSQTRFL
jgi:hypothetical protein